MVFTRCDRKEFLKSKAIFQIYVFLIYTIVSVASLGSVFAPAVSAEQVCCEETLGGALCVNTDESNCNPDAQKAAVSCEQTSFCQIGCCLNNVDGSCSSGVPESVCNDDSSSTFYNVNSCGDVGACQQGCCELGSNFIFNTKKECEILIADFYPSLDVGSAWDSAVTDELSCVLQASEEAEGCCVNFDGSCDFTTKNICSTTGSENPEGGPGFYEDNFCSDGGLQCDCEAQSYKGCVNGEEDVFWFDSCGNKEDVAEDCDFLGLGGTATFCKQDDDAFCQTVDCLDTTDYPNNNHDPEMGGFRQNGESWCVYEGKVGPGNDLVGSRHYKVQCVNGDELIEPCRDFREELCVQILPEEEGQINIASCTDNDGYKCALECNEKPFDENNEDNRDCCEQYSESCIWTGEDDNVGVCVPVVPPGMSFDDNFNSGPVYDAGDVCDSASSTCRSVWTKKLFGGWKCKQNCHCTTEQWVSDMNNFCVSMGDCGGFYNVAGDFISKGLGTSGSQTKNFNPEKYMLDFPFSSFENSGDILTLTYSTAGISDIWEEGMEIDYITAYLAASFFFTTGLAGIVSSAITGLLGLGPIGWAVAAVAILLGFLFGWGKTKTLEHNFTCEPWVAPDEQDNCDECNDISIDGICTEYKCRSLGKNCELVNEENPLQIECVYKAPNDVVPPAISPWLDMIQGQMNEQNVNYQVDIIGASTCGAFQISPMVEPLKEFVVGVQTNELAKCRYDVVHANNFYEMDNKFEQDYFTTDHSFTMVYPGGQDYTLLVRCVDLEDNGDDSCEYAINFETKDEPDFTPPVVLHSSIPNGGSVAFGVNETPLVLYMNEPVETCRWSKQNVPFEQMSVDNGFFCGCDSGETNACTGSLESADGEELCDFVGEDGFFLYDEFDCVGLLTDVEQEQKNTYYISCVDIEKNDGTGCNVNENYEFNLFGSSPLNIISLEPENGTYFDSFFVLRAATSGGADNGNAVCSYDDGFFGKNEFFDTGGTIHTQEQDRSVGTYEYTIACEDSVGNDAQGMIKLTIDVDEIPPEIENIYVDNGILFVVTDEPSSCEYSTTDPFFDIGEGFPMTGTLVEEHSLVVASDVYYVKCYDGFDNVGPVAEIFP
tara:strand:- start:495 stop:3821 length:3327 start_codon:yes stop_codon:yes gene_type:complete